MATVSTHDSATAPSADDAAVGAALRDYAVAELGRALAFLAWRGPRLHGGVHQARKSLRRARSVLALGTPLLGPGADLVDRECRRLNSGMSDLRDAQALVTVLDHLIGKEDGGEALVVLRRARRRAASVRAERARVATAEDPNLANKRALLTTLRAALMSLPWTALTHEAVMRCLEACVRRAEEAEHRARTSGRVSDWHRWRRRARRVSQQYRALGKFAAHRKDERKRYKELAVQLGEAQDYSLLREHTGRNSPFPRPDREILRELGNEGMRHLRERIADRAAAADDEHDDSHASILRESTPN